MKEGSGTGAASGWHRSSPTGVAPMLWAVGTQLSLTLGGAPATRES